MKDEKELLKLNNESQRKINLKIKLYAKKDPSYVEDTSDSTAANLDQKNNDDSANESDKESDEESDEESDDESDS